MPVTNVDRTQDSLSAHGDSEEYSTMSASARLAYSAYDADRMHGLPLGVQIVGQGLEEEKVLLGMRIIDHALRAKGVEFKKQLDLRTLG